MLHQHTCHAPPNPPTLPPTPAVCTTRQGVWLARAPTLPGNLTLVMDLEGSDGRERGEDDTNFERQVGWECVMARSCPKYL